MDLGFADARGRIYNRMKFSLSLSQRMGLVAGTYQLTIVRNGGDPIGGPIRFELR
jgi:hypothetical protein